MFKSKLKYFHIRTPYFSAWQKYGWDKDDYGLGLRRDRIDNSAEKKESVLISYGKNKNIYSLDAKKIQECTVEFICGTDVQLYIIPISMLKIVKEKKVETIEDLAKIGVF